MDSFRTLKWRDNLLSKNFIRRKCALFFCVSLWAFICFKTRWSNLPTLSTSPCLMTLSIMPLQKRDSRTLPTKCSKTQRLRIFITRSRPRTIKPHKLRELCSNQFRRQLLKRSLRKLSAKTNQLKSNKLKSLKLKLWFLTMLKISYQSRLKELKMRSKKLKQRMQIHRKRAAHVAASLAEV